MCYWYFGQYFVVTRFWPFAKLFVHNGAILLHSVLQCTNGFTNVTP